MILLALKILTLFLVTAVLVVGLMALSIKLRLNPKTTGIVSATAGLFIALSGIGIGLQPFLSSQSALENIVFGGILGVIGFLIFLFSIKATLEIRDKQKNRT